MALRGAVTPRGRPPRHCAQTKLLLKLTSTLSHAVHQHHDTSG